MIAFAFWLLGTFINLHPTLTPFIPLPFLLLTPLLPSSHILNQTPPSNTLLSFSVLLLMPQQLNNLAFIPSLNKLITQPLNPFTCPILLLLLIL
ncbi:anion permease, partial [Staphylococcus epidermidis]|uniref:anion permease n=1 Tax=Staphylococcus epidermidis TaxID=1282 RepID=UPI0037D99DB3